MNFLDIMAKALSVFFAGWITAHLIMIAMWGRVTIIEIQPWILYPEIALLSAITLWYIVRLIKGLKER